MSSVSSISDEHSIEPDSPIAHATIQSQEDQYEYQTLGDPGGNVSNVRRLKVVVVWMAVILLLIRALYICVDLFRKQL
jgi:hypothetical protein